LQLAEESLPRLRQLIVNFEKRLTAVTSKLPPFVKDNDPRFKKPLEDLASCQNLLDEVKLSMKKYVTKLTKFKNAALAAEKELAKL
jgi:hypothetical protein